MTVTALHSTSQTQSRSTHCCFTQRPYHSLQQIRASSRSFITAACQSCSGCGKMWPPELMQLQGHDGPVNSVAFSRDGSKIISGSSDKTIRVWDASTGIEMLPPLRGHNGWILSVAFSPDGSKIISGSDDKTIRVWDASTGAEMLPPLRGHDHWIRSVAFSPDGSKIISGSDDKTIRVWDASTGAEILPPFEAMIA
jgi:WD40 repeat protein